jgi:carbamoyltransferase
MATVVGIAGARRNACVALWKDGVAEGICELERVTRVHRAALTPGRLPIPALEALGWSPRGEVSSYVVAEERATLPGDLPVVRLDHHATHAAAAFLTSPFARAVILVCDEHSSPEVSVWLGDGTRITNLDWPWPAAGFAQLYSASAEVLGYERRGQEHRLEALARLGRGREAGRLEDLWRYEDGTLRVRPNWRACVSDWVTSARSLAHHAEIASSIQHHLGSLLLQLLADIRSRAGVEHLCLGGGLFYNTYFNTLIQQSGLFDRTFVPINAGNAGLAAGAALATACGESGRRTTESLSPFLGPSSTTEEIKSILDNCKLSYELVPEGKLIDVTVDSLRRGALVGWFQGRMEWGPRALGHRSILADPRAPYVLENLNVFLKKRDRHRAYGLSVRQSELERHFVGPARSPFMEYEYGLRDPQLLRAIVPDGAAALRVQTIDETPELFRKLHEAYHEATGVGVLVNTSFNGFLEPIVCSPRDAVRVFYGTGLDMLVADRFVIRK